MSVEPSRPRKLAGLGLALFSLVALGTGVAAQELTPRAYWPAPKGTQVFSLGYVHSSGDVVMDPSLPITGVESSIDTVQLGYLRYFGLFGKTANVQIAVPATRGASRGYVEDEYRRRDVSGLADSRIRLSVNLLGAPILDPAGFQALRAKPRTIVGASLSVQLPTGDYEPDRLINIGANRWAVKPALGVIWPVRPTWLVELELGVWLYGANDEFLGVTREQNPIVSSELHLVKRLRPGFWASLDANFYTGGRTTVDRELKADLQRNSRLGATLVFPFRPRNALRFNYSNGIVTESGGDFQQLGVSYQRVW